MQDSLNMTSDDTESFRVMMLNLVGLLLPPNSGKWVMWMRDHFGIAPETEHLVLEHIVTDTDHHRFVKVWPSSECSFPNNLLCDLVGGSSLALGGGDRDNHALVARVGLEYTDVVVSQCTVMREGMKRRKSCEGLISEMGTFQEAKDELDTIAQCW